MNMGFYIIEKKQMDILFSKPLDVNNSILPNHESLVKWILKIYEDTLSSKHLGTLQYLRFEKLHALIEEKYCFIFVLVRNRQVLPNELQGQMFFYSNLFLNAFNIKNIENAEEFISELKHTKKKHVSESLTQSFLIWEALDKHVETVDIRNMLEAFTNIINAFLEGGCEFWLKNGKNNEKELFLAEVKKHLAGTICLKKHFQFSGINIRLKDSIIINERLSDFKKELLEWVRFLARYIEIKEGLDILRDIIGEKVVKMIRNEWYRLQNLGVLKELMNELWR